MRAVFLILIFTYAAADSVKKTDGGRNRRQVPGCAKIDTVYHSGDVKVVEDITYTASQCGHICVGTVECMGWSIYLPQPGDDEPTKYKVNSCVLKAGPVASAAVPHKGFVSGEKGCF